MILSAGTITPKSITSKLLHCNTTLTIFLPMSCTSPFTVAITTLPLLEPFCFVALINGSKYATDCFITRADFTTCGRNILPSPNKSPTTSMPAMSGPSITSNGVGNFWRASSVSSMMCVVIPFTSACFKRSSTGHVRHSATESTALSSLPWLRYFSEISSKRSVPSGVRFNTASSITLRNSGSRSS